MSKPETERGLEHLVRASFCREAPEVLSVWGSDKPKSRHHIFSPYGTALHLDRLAFDETLAFAARDAGADLKLGCAARFAAQPRGGFVVQFPEASLPADDVSALRTPSTVL